MPKIDQKSKLVGYSDWINDQPWTNFPTFTTSYELTLPSARRLMERTHLAFKRYSGGDCRLFWVAEPFEVKDGYHCHGLLYLPDSMINSKGYLHRHHFQNLVDIYTKMAGSKLVANNGGKLAYDKRHRIDLQKFDGRRNAGAYALKYIMKAERGQADYDLFI